MALGLRLSHTILSESPPPLPAKHISPPQGLSGLGSGQSQFLPIPTYENLSILGRRCSKGPPTLSAYPLPLNSKCPHCARPNSHLGGHCLSPQGSPHRRQIAALGCGRHHCPDMFVHIGVGAAAPGEALSSQWSLGRASLMP